MPSIKSPPSIFREPDSRYDLRRGNHEVTNQPLAGVAVAGAATGCGDGFGVAVVGRLQNFHAGVSLGAFEVVPSGLLYIGL